MEINSTPYNFAYNTPTMSATPPRDESADRWFYRLFGWGIFLMVGMAFGWVGGSQLTGSTLSQAYEGTNKKAEARRDSEMKDLRQHVLVLGGMVDKVGHDYESLQRVIEANYQNGWMVGWHYAFTYDEVQKLNSAVKDVRTDLVDLRVEEKKVEGKAEGSIHRPK